MTFAAEPASEEIIAARLFIEPIVPVGREPSPDENALIARVLERYIATAESARRLDILQQFVATQTTSPWRPSVMGQLGVLYAREGYFSRAATLWNDAWEAAKDTQDKRSVATADFALGQLLEQAVAFGQVNRLERRLEEIGERNVRGPAGQQVNEARQGLYLLQNQHENATFSGPAALKALLRETDPNLAAVKVIDGYKPSHEGTTLRELFDLAGRAGMSLQMSRWESARELPVPSVVHLRSDHFTAVIAHREGGYQLQDGALGGEFWMSEAAILDEASGYVLSLSTEKADGWRPVTAEEGATVVGHCQPGAPANDDPCGCDQGPPGMPTYAIHPVAASVILRDTPLGYVPPVGPDVQFRLLYNHRVDPQPQTPFFGGVGPMWEMGWQSHIEEAVMITAPYAARIVRLRGEGVEWYHSYSPPTHWRSRASLVQVSTEPPRYERRLPDGTVEVFALGDRPASVPGRHIFLTEVVDPQGQSLAFSYDAVFRLVAITDAVGQVTTLEYLDAANPFSVTRVTDPFGRFATLTYDGLGRLSTVTDVAGLASSFVYGSNDFIVSMRTPYGTTGFRTASMFASTRYVEVTDPVGAMERVEFVFDGSGADAVPASEVPVGFASFNTFMDRYTSYYWDKRAMALYPGDYTKAVATTWNIGSNSGYDHGTSRNIPHSVKGPLESRVWFRYPSQPSHHAVGIGTTPIEVARVLDDGTTQSHKSTLNAQGLVTSTTDPVGRQTTYTYAANGIDLLEVRQVTAGGTDLLASYANYNAQHLPGTVTDAAGQFATTTYNAAGQPLTVTNARSETTTYVYDPSGSGELHSVTAAVAGATVSYTYDSFGRVRTVTEPDGYSLTTDYDTLDRVTTRTYPDGSTESLTYARLDLVEQRDRLGRITRHFYDALGRRTSTQDPAGRTITQTWCDCGSLDALIDANGNRTSWERDVQGRITREIRADGVTDTLYTYDGLGRMATTTDPQGQVTTHTYLADDSLSTTVYTNSQIQTPGVSYAYDPTYLRVTTMVDGIGTTTYAYKPAGMLGAGRVTSVDGPLVDDTITYAYDQLGRVTTRAINGVSNTVAWTFDALGRVTSETNVLGTFTYAYDGVTSRMATVTYPNGQMSLYSYLPSIQDRRLRTIHHRYPSTATLSAFEYTYDVAGNILTWRQQADTTAVLWRYGYDAADQLMRAVKHATDPQETILQRHAYAYDPAGNRTVEQIDDAITLSSYDALDRLAAQVPGGPIQLAGTLNEPGTVTLAGVPAVVDALNGFRGSVLTVAGTNAFTIVARDAAGNETTQQYEVDVQGVTKTFTYDANGNVTSDGTHTLEWDARNQLVAVSVGTHRSEFTYDGQQRRVRIVEKENGVVQSDTKVLWCDERICEERAADGLTVTRRAFGLGEQVAGYGRYFTMDHLESVSEVTDAPAGLLARYAFGPWGSRTVIAGTDVTSAGFAGLRVHAASTLALGLYRGYDAVVGRWLSRDPLGDVDGPNRYAYVGNSPVSRVDPLGLQWSWTTPGTKKNVKDGVEAAWLSCLNKGDRRVYWKETPFNPIVRQEEWRKWRDDFGDGCRKNPSPGYSRYSTCAVAGVGYNAPTGYCVCCEGCTPK